MAIGMDVTGTEDGEEMEDDVGEVYTEGEDEVDDPEEEVESNRVRKEEEEEKDLHGDEKM